MKTNLKPILKPMLKAALLTLVLCGSVAGLSFQPSSSAYAQPSTQNGTAGSPPQVAPIAPITTTEGNTIDFVVQATPGTSGDTLTYDLVGNSAQDLLNHGATLDSATGEFNFPTDEDAGPRVYNALISVSDGTNAAVQTPLKITVNEANTAPYINIDNSAPIQVFENEDNFTEFTRDSPDNGNGDFGDVDHDANGNNLQLLSLSTSSLPSGAHVYFNRSSVSNQYIDLDWVPSESQGGKTFNVTFKLSDGKLTTSKTFAFQVVKTNSAPILQTISDQQVKGGTTDTFTAKATDIDVPKQTLTYSLTNAPAGATINPTTGKVTYTTPVVAQPTSVIFTVNVTDNGNDVPGPQTDSQDVLVRITPGNPTKFNGVTFTGKVVEAFSDTGDLDFNGIGETYIGAELEFVITNNTPFFLRDVKVAGPLYGPVPDEERDDDIAIGSAVHTQQFSAFDFPFFYPALDPTGADQSIGDVLIERTNGPVYPLYKFTWGRFTLPVNEQFGFDVAPGSHETLDLEVVVPYGNAPSAAQQLVLLFGSGAKSKTITTISGPVTFDFTCDQVNHPGSVGALTVKNSNLNNPL